MDLFVVEEQQGQEWDEGIGQQQGVKGQGNNKMEQNNNKGDHLVQTPRSSTYWKQGKAHFRRFILGSMALAMDSRTIMLVSSVANQPSSFIRFSRMMVSMLLKRLMPLRSANACPLRMLKQFTSWLQYSSKLPSTIFLPSKLESRQISFAHISDLPSMMDLMKFTKFLLSTSSSSMTIPTSMRLTTIFSLQLLSSFIMSSSSSRLSIYSLFMVSVSNFRLLILVQTMKRVYLRKPQISVNKLQDCSCISTRMLPPWQSAWMKLFFISISKKVVDPSRAITLFSGCGCFQQYITGTPSTKVSTSTDSTVFSSNGYGNDIYLLSLNISLNRCRFFISKVKSTCSVSVFFIECSLTGISMAGEMKEARQLMKKRRLTSLVMYLSTFGCRTFTATFLPLYLARYTWLTEPEAMGTRSNYSKISSILRAQDFLKYSSVVQNE